MEIGMGSAWETGWAPAAGPKPVMRFKEITKILHKIFIIAPRLMQ